MAVAFIALGGNLGDVRQAFVRARAGLQAQACAVAASSRLYETEPLQAPGDSRVGHKVPHYLNAVCRVHTCLLPRALLQLLFDLERQAGRVRSTLWASRVLDLDLLAYDDVHLRSADLNLPHPAASSRPFVLYPWCDVGANWRLPPHGMTPSQLRAALEVPHAGMLAAPWYW